MLFLLDFVLVHFYIHLNRVRGYRIPLNITHIVLYNLHIVVQD